MAQTTNQVTMVNCKIEGSTDGAVWTDISGFGNSVTFDGGERATEETDTFSGDTPIITAGKRGGLTVTARVVYTEGVSDPVEVVRAAYENLTPYYLRWSPKGGTTGQFQYTTTVGIVKNPVYPAGEANSAAPIMAEIVLAVAKITKAVAA